MTAINAATVPWRCQTGVVNSWEGSWEKGRFHFPVVFLCLAEQCPKQKVTKTASETLCLLVEKVAIGLWSSSLF